MFQVALAWWILEKTGSAVAMGTVLILTSVPTLLFLLVGGVAVDRYPRLRLLLWSDALRGAVVSIAAWLIWADQLNVWHVYVLSVTFGIVFAFFQPAYRAAVLEVTQGQDLPSANSLTSLAGQLSGLVGPAIGAGIVTAGGTSLAFALDGLSFFAAAACLLPLLPSFDSNRDRVPLRRVGDDLREGLLFVARSAWLWVTICVAGLSTIAYAGPMQVALPFLIKDQLNGDVGVLGLFYSISALGSILAAAWIGHCVRLRRRGPTLYGAWMLIGLLVMSIGLPVGIPAILAIAFGIGACNSVLGLVWTNTLQECVPARLLGRVTSIDYLGSSILVPAGYAIGGWATDTVGAPLVFVGGGALMTVLVAVGLLHPDIRNLD